MFFYIIIGIDWMINSRKDSIVFCLKIKFLSFCKQWERYSTITHKRESIRPDFTNSKKTQIQINRCFTYDITRSEAYDGMEWAVPKREIMQDPG